MMSTPGPSSRQLRGLAARRDLPNELDLANVIEGIEDVGRGELSTVKILLGNILAQLGPVVN